MKHHLIQILIVGALLLSGCGRKLGTKDTAPGAFAHGAAPEAPAQKPVNLLVVVDPGQPVSTAAPVAEVMLTGGHRVELRLVDAPLGQPMEVTFEARNARGDLLQKLSTQTVPTDPGWTVYNAVPASYETASAGRWNWTVRVTGGRTYTTSVSVLPPTPAQMARFSRNEAASENLLRAFSRYWLGHGEHFYTKLIQPTDRTGVSNVVYVQILRFAPKLELTEVSGADTLNGVTYRGKATFGCEYFRVFAPECEGWSEWSAAKDDLANFVVAHTSLAKAPLGSLLKLDYTLLEKDDNWFLNVAGDVEVINGQRHPEQPLAVVAPSPEEIAGLLAHGRVPVRENDKARGDLARRGVQPLTRPAIDTMTLVRGRTLR